MVEVCLYKHCFHSLSYWGASKQVGEINHNKRNSKNFFSELSCIKSVPIMKAVNKGHQPTVEDFLSGKSAITLALYHHFVTTCQSLFELTIYPTKTMIGIAHSGKCIAYITQLGKNFVHVVFPFKKPYPENLCFVKIAQVPGDAHQFNHHFRMYYLEDVNEEVIGFMKLACEGEQKSRI